ncbi:MAG: hypothetical protein R3F59_36910 [Myxococcota bacterium]
MWLWLAACPAAPDPVDLPVGPRLVSGPTLAAPGDPGVRLAARLLVDTDVPTVATVTLDDGVTQRVVSFAAASEAHDLPLLGLHPETHYDVTVALAAGGREVAAALGLDVPALDLVVPHAEVRVDAPERATGLVLVPPSAGAALLVAYDAEGLPVYVAEAEAELRALGTTLAPDGALRVTALAGDRLVERSLLSGTVRGSWPTTWATGFHHEMRREADGGVLALTKEQVPVADYPVDADDLAVRADVDVEADVVVSLDHDGAVEAPGGWPSCSTAHRLRRHRSGRRAATTSGATPTPWRWIRATTR